ncbi:hypothetical protein [Streptomyces triculaminicus]|uniref:hypothetical protein n=1 Tax=Streptomyces triculaminicus TaxID=2816232 RepID=UPI0037CCD4A0
MDDYVRMPYTLKFLQTGDVAKLGEYANYTTITRVPLKSTVIRLEPIALTTELSGGNVAPITLAYNDKNITGVMGPSGSQYPEGQGREWDLQMTDNTCIILGNTPGGHHLKIWAKPTAEHLRAGGVETYKTQAMIPNGDQQLEDDQRDVQV